MWGHSTTSLTSIITQSMRAFPIHYISILYFSSSKNHFFYFTYQFYKTPLITLFILHYIILKYHKLSLFSFFFFFSSHSPHLPQWPTLANFPHLPQWPTLANFPHLPQCTPANSLPQLHQHQPMTHTCNHSQATIFSIFLLFSSNPQVIKSNQDLDSVLKQQKQKQFELHSVKKQDAMKIALAKTLILPPFFLYIIRIFSISFFFFWVFVFGDGNLTRNFKL